ncbi:hypothetical protein UFOVP48_23 [uncultured Caudovirales phage]|uniref:Uncharacterized protein n=1 Tax=uncultured Caudovirales phage TaxID=2100421 RepID=A0A6J5KMK5_9CAUD|nr:hypothetical protein UFOVP48_23 [uncultured Caudovirales phage]
MTNYKWKFTMGTDREPVWEVFRSQTSFALIAYAKRAKDAGWFVRISGVNGQLGYKKLYIDDDIFPPDFMIAMLGMNKNENN